MEFKYPTYIRFAKVALSRVFAIGMYIVNLQTENEKLSRKFVKQ
jgi:hypothetical protein